MAKSDTIFLGVRRVVALSWAAAQVVRARCQQTEPNVRLVQTTLGARVTGNACPALQHGSSDTPSKILAFTRALTDFCTRRLYHRVWLAVCAQSARCSRPTNCDMVCLCACCGPWRKFRTTSRGIMTTSPPLSHRVDQILGNLPMAQNQQDGAVLRRASTQPLAQEPNCLFSGSSPMPMRRRWQGHFKRQDSAVSITSQDSESQKPQYRSTWREDSIRTFSGVRFAADGIQLGYLSLIHI